MAERVLVADIGGTNARFALARIDGAIELDPPHVFLAEDHQSIRAAADAFLEAVHVKPKAACFAVAGPITDDVVEFTNSPWTLDVEKIRAQLGLSAFEVVNDFEALATGVRDLKEADFLRVKDGAGDRAAPILVMGPGTGLGQALVVPANGKDRVVATEGGHVAFAPTTEEEIEVLRVIMREHKRVSIERLLSGRGLVNIYRALCTLSGTPCAFLYADEITGAAISGRNPVAARAVDLFCAVLGSAAGDAVLASGARGGVLLGGGILTKIEDLFLKSDFIDRFTDKGRMRFYVEDVPVRLIIRDGAALVGAARRLKDRLETH